MSEIGNRVRGLPAYALTIFIGAFLLFQVQPLIAKYILPWFGGGPGVWNTCMLFFQMVLLVGYAYAHLVSRLNPRKQTIVHLLFLVAAVAMLPITPQESWKPRDTGNPTLPILWLLLANLGLPYFVLSSTGPLLQQWASRVNPGLSPYRLYALSNLGSLLALISFPLFVEPHFTRQRATTLWGVGLVVYAVACAYCAALFWRDWAQNTAQVDDPQSAGKISPGCDDDSAMAGERPVEGKRVDASMSVSPVPGQWILWLLLPACASLLLLATTNKLCQDVAVVPFLWVLPLGLYLLSFVVCFANRRWYVRLPFALALAAALSATCLVLFKGTAASLIRQIEIYCGSLFVCCMVCHGELYRLRPEPNRLTTFYLLIATGGALGGLFVAVIAPLVFTDYYELHWGLWLCALLFTIVCARDRETKPGDKQWIWLACALPLQGFCVFDWALGRLSNHVPALPKSSIIVLRVILWVLAALLVLSFVVRKTYRRFQHWRLLSCIWLALGLVALGSALFMQGLSSDKNRIYTVRNFYGILKVYELRQSEPLAHHFLLQHGRITHGLQFIDAERAHWPTTYYNQESGVGLALAALDRNQRRIGLVGLGAGTLAAYARPGDELHIYEINPEVERIAATKFQYLTNSSAKVKVVLGDARLSLEKESPRDFDLLVLDAFSSDAIPVHLLTREAFEVYRRHLNPHGVIAVHISNHFLNLKPVIENLARNFNFYWASIDYEEDEEKWWSYSSTWMLLTHDPTILASPAIAKVASKPAETTIKVPLWTDDFTSLFQIMK